jgi:hypothetical protein
VVICDLHFTPARLGEGLEIATRAPPPAALRGAALTGVPGEDVRAEALRRGVDEVIAAGALARLRDAALRAMKKA